MEYKTNKKLLQIISVILIIAAIIGIFFLKNAKKNDNEVIDDTVETPLVITSVNLAEIKASGKPTVIDFGSESCVPCRQMEPVLVAVNAKLQGKAIVQYMDVWKYSEGLEAFPISVIPTQFFFNADGTPFVPSEKLATEIPFTYYSTSENGEHVFTVHQGGLTEQQIMDIFKEMGIE